MSPLQRAVAERIYVDALNRGAVRTVQGIVDEGEFEPGQKPAAPFRPKWKPMDRDLSPDERAYLWMVR